METAIKSKIWLSSPHMGGSEQRFIKEAFESNWVAPLGPNVQGFERDLEEYLGRGAQVAALSSGTGALHLALTLLGVGQDDLVLCQSFTFAASANPITYVGASPVFIDSEEDTWNLSPELVEEAIEGCLKNGKKPKCIIAVHLYGMPYKVKAIKEIATKYDIPVIEDAAEALGSTYFGKHCGMLGDIGILSFNGNKIITTSGGGALVTKDQKTKQKAVFLSTQARDNAPHYQHSEIGFNYRMSNIVAGIGRGQMEVLDSHVAARRGNYHYYVDKLGDIPELTFHENADGCISNRWLTCITTPSYKIREEIRLALLSDNIESRPLWKPLHLQPVFKTNLNFTNGNSEDLFNRGLCLPSGSNLGNEALERIVLVIRNLFGHD